MLIGHYGTKVGGNSGGSKVKKRMCTPRFRTLAPLCVNTLGYMLCQIVINKFVYQK